MIIAVDFDGTCVTHEYPEIGKSIGAEKVLKALVENGHQIVLCTMRGHKTHEGRDLLQEAVDWFKENDAYESGVNHMKLIIENLKKNANPKAIGAYDEGIYMMKYNENKIIYK